MNNNRNLHPINSTVNNLSIRHEFLVGFCRIYLFIMNNQCEKNMYFFGGEEHCHFIKILFNVLTSLSKPEQWKRTKNIIQDSINNPKQIKFKQLSIGTVTKK